MRAKALIPILADIYRVDAETAFAIDRSLAECGLRAKAKGRHLPEMTRREALVFLIACMTTKKATKAGEEVVFFLNFSGTAPTEPNRARGPEGDLREPDETYIERVNLVERLDTELTTFKTAHGEQTIIGFVDYLLVLCRLLENQQIDPGYIKLEICTSHPSINVSFSSTDRNTTLHTDHFFPDAGGRSEAAKLASIEIRTTSSIYGEALLAIVARTADPIDRRCEP